LHEKTKQWATPMKYQLAESISFTEVDDEAVLLDLNTGSYFGLNHVGAQFLGALHNGETFEQAMTNVANQYTESNEKIGADLEDLLQQLLEKNLVIAKA